MRMRALVPGAVIVLAALLAGCTATAPAPTGSPSADASTPSPLPNATLTPTPTPSEKTWASPAECAALPLSPGAAYDGATLGACVAMALRSTGSGLETIRSGSQNGEVRFRYAPDFEMQGTIDDAEGSMEVTYIDGQMWIDRGTGPIAGDVTSADPEVMIAGIAGELTRIFADPAATVDLIAASPTWTVQEPAPVELPNGTTVDAYRIVSDAAFSWGGVGVDAYELWYSDGWVPVGATGTVSFLGLTETATQYYHDLGSPVEITPVG
ncbi:hypothetical protein PFZ55_31200 [Streptomyces sp. MS2A]|nr:hypothetical protein [Streptomyces sp. MS2A]